LGGGGGQSIEGCLCLVAGGHGGLEPLGNAVEFLLEGFFPLPGNGFDLGELGSVEAGVSGGGFEFAIHQCEICGSGGDAILEAVVDALHQAGAGHQSAGFRAGGFHPPLGGLAGGFIRVLEGEHGGADGFFGGLGLASEAGKQAIVVGEGGLGGFEDGEDRVLFVEQLVHHEDGVGRFFREAGPLCVVAAGAFQRLAGVGDDVDILD
jgi:hypothetical protein